MHLLLFFILKTTLQVLCNLCKISSKQLLNCHNSRPDGWGDRGRGREGEAGVNPWEDAMNCNGVQRLVASCANIRQDRPLL